MKILPYWEKDSAAVCRKIEESSAILKIVLKTRDEPLFIKKWIDHHSRIVGMENLIILDNGSTNFDVLSYYSETPAELNIIEFSSHYNMVHDYDGIFAGLYGSLKKSCKYFIVLDSDEFLFGLFDGLWDRTSKIVHALNHTKSIIVYPSIYLYNMFGSEENFKLDNFDETMLRNLYWGKPILRADGPHYGFINHNCNINSNYYCSGSFLPIFTLHMTELSREQRISANLKKMAYLMSLPYETAADVIMGQDFEQFHPSALAYADEIKLLANMSVRNPTHCKEFISVRQGYHPSFDGDETTQKFETFIQNLRNVGERTFITCETDQWGYVDRNKPVFVESVCIDFLAPKSLGIEAQIDTDLASTRNKVCTKMDFSGWALGRQAGDVKVIVSSSIKNFDLKIDLSREDVSSLYSRSWDKCGFRETLMLDEMGPKITIYLQVEGEKKVWAQIVTKSVV